MENYYRQMQDCLARAEQRVGQERLAATFFAHFFEHFPETMNYFADTDISKFGPRKYRIISTFLLDMIRHPDFAEAELTDEVRRHQDYGLKDKDYYFALIDALQLTVKEALDDEWTVAMEECWQDVSMAMKGVIRQAFTFI